MINLFLSLAMLAAGALIWGGVVLIRRGQKQKGALMTVAALVLVANVLIIALPA